MPSTSNPHMQLPPHDTFTTREVAKQLGLAVRSVQLMVDRGDLVAWKTSGGHRRISRESVQRWLSKTSGNAPAVDVPKTLAIRNAGRRAEDASKGPIRRRSTDSRHPTVVLIEDSNHVQAIIRVLLQQSHPEVALHVAGDAMVGLSMCGALRPDVLIVDIMLPGIDGPTLIHSLRSQPHFERIQIVVVTSLDETHTAPYAFGLEGIPVIEKTKLTEELPLILTQQLAKAHSLKRSD